MTTCPVCSGTWFDVEMLTDGLRVRTCRECGFLVSDIVSARPRGGEYEGIDGRAYLRSVGLTRRRQAVRIVGMVRNRGVENGTWIDVGCGLGFLLHEAARAGYDVLGFDEDEAACREAGKLVGEGRVRLGELAGAARAEVVSCLDVLEHIPPARLGAFAHRVRETLAPGGVWVVKVPTTEGIFFRLAHHRLTRPARPLLRGSLRRLWQADYRFPHTVYFRRGTLVRFLGRHGFSVVDSAYLEEIPAGTAGHRLAFDACLPRWLARLGGPLVRLASLVDRLHGRSDALVVLAQRSEEFGPDAVKGKM